MFVWAIRHISTATLTDISPSDNEVHVLGTHHASYDHWDPRFTGRSTSNGNSNNNNRRTRSETINEKSKDGRVPKGKSATLEPTTSNLRSASTIAPTVLSSLPDTFESTTDNIEPRSVRPQSYKNKGEKNKGMMSYKTSKSTSTTLTTQDPTENKPTLRASKSKKGKSEKNVFGGMKSKTAKMFSKGKGYPYDAEDGDKRFAPTQEPTTLVTKMPPRHYYAMKYYPSMKYAMSSSRSTKYLVKKKMDSDKGMSKKLTKSQISRSSSKRRGWPSIDERDTQAPMISTIYPTQAPTKHEAIMTRPTQAPAGEEPGPASEAPISLNNFTGSPTYAIAPTQAPGTTVTPANSTAVPVDTILTPSQAPATTPLLNNSTQEPAMTPSNPTLVPTTPPSYPTQSPTTVPQAPSMIPINSSTLAPITSGNSTPSPTVTSTRAPSIIPIDSTQNPTNAAVVTLTQSPTTAPTNSTVMTFTQSPTIGPAPTNSTQYPSNPNNNSTLAPITLNSNTIDFEGCAQDLISADVNNNDAIDINEYLIFVHEYEKRKCVYVTADELTLEQKAAFNLLACMCRFEAGADPDSCCLADNANLSVRGGAMLLDPQNRTQDQADFLITICTLTDASIDYQCGVPTST